MSEINKLNGFNSNYGFYQKDDSESSVKKEAQPEQAKAPETKSVSPEKVFDAMNVLAQQNAYNVQGRTLVNPKDYLSEERISSIENSIAEFEKGVEKYANVVKNEFGSVFSEDTVYAVAANAFALNA